MKIDDFEKEGVWRRLRDREEGMLLALLNDEFGDEMWLICLDGDEVRVTVPSVSQARRPECEAYLNEVFRRLGLRSCLRASP